MEILIYYILPNVALFGGLYLLSKGIENVMWFIIENHDAIVARDLSLIGKRK
mgnify:CR=1 FL=1|jgi:hypothetical protein